MYLRNLSLIILTSLGLSTSFISTASAGSITITGENSKTTQVQSDRTRTNGSTTTNRTVTYPNGTTSSSTGAWTGNGNGNYTGTVDRTNRRGTTNNYQVNGQYSKNNALYQILERSWGQTDNRVLTKKQVLVLTVNARVRVCLPLQMDRHSILM